MTGVFLGRRLSEGRSKWSKWAWETRIKSMGGSSRMFRAGASRRRGPPVQRPRPMPTRLEKTGSVRMVISPTRRRTVDLAAVWVGHATVLLRVGAVTIDADPACDDRAEVDLLGDRHRRQMTIVYRAGRTRDG